MNNLRTSEDPIQKLLALTVGVPVFLLIAYFKFTGLGLTLTSHKFLVAVVPALIIGGLGIWWSIRMAKKDERKKRAETSMEQLIASLIPAKGEQTPSQSNSDKLDSLKTMLSDVQQGTPPIPVKDDAVLKKLEEVTMITDKKLDTIQESADVAAQQAGKEKETEE